MRNLARRARRWLAGPGLGVKGGPQAWYVDSVNGDDGNDGLTDATPFQTIGQLQSVMSAGDTAYLAKDSTWREELIVPGANCTVDVYGTGARPILDASAVVANASFTKTSGRTNVYEIEITPDYDVSQNWVNVWEDNNFLVWAADVATCDSTPGSYFVDDLTTSPATLYVHATGSANVISNGRVYEHSQRLTGLNARSAANCTITGIHTRGQIDENGSMLVGLNGTVTDCLATRGSKHSYYGRYGANFTNCHSETCYHGTSDITHFVSFETTGDGTGTAAYVDCTATQNITTPANCIGFYAHTATGVWAEITYTNCDTLGNFFDIGFDTTGVVDATYTDCTANIKSASSKDGFRLGNQAGGTYTYDGCVVTGSFRCISNVNNTNCTLIVTDCSFTHATADAGTIFCGTAAVTATVTGNSFNCTSTSGLRRVIYTNNAGCILTFTGNTITSTNYQRILFLLVSHSYTSDFNTFYDNNDAFNIFGTTYTTVSAYKTATGQDANSTVAN